MPARAAQIPDPDAALDGAAGVRAVRALRRIAERGLIHGDADERKQADRILDYLDTGAEGGLEAALGLAGPGHTGALTRYRLDRRDVALRRLWRACWPDLSANAAAGLIAQHWRREAALRGRAGDTPPQEPRAMLRRLSDAGHSPLSARRIREILRGDAGDLHPVEIANPSADA
jgi:hypothetical protein